MNDLTQPPTDSPYKFFAIGGLLFAAVTFVFLLRGQEQARDQYVTAQVELQARGFVEGGVPPSDVEVRRAYFRREAARVVANDTMRLAGGTFGHVIGISLVISLSGFVLWWVRVQRYEDAILRATATKLARENRGA